MGHRLYQFVAAALLALSMWLWVQRIAIAHQQAEAALRGIPRGNLSDLYPRWLGTRELLLHGRDPYGSDITREIQAGYYGRPIDPSRPNDPKDQQAFAYPLYVVFVLAPTIKLPFAVVQRGFLTLLVLLTAGSVPLWFRALRWRVSASAQLLWMILTVGCFPAIQGFKLQQLTLLVAGLMAISMSLLACGYLFLSGALLAVASIKPQLVVLPAAWLCLWVLGNWKERQKFVWGFGSALLALIIGSELLLPGWIGEFRRASAEYWRYTGGGRSVLDVELTPVLGHVVSTIVVCMLLYCAWRLRSALPGTLEFGWMLALTMATTLAVIPMFAPYNQVLLVPALMVIVRAAPSLWQGARLLRFLLALTVFSVSWPWLASALLTIGLLFLPGPVVQRAWIAPLLTNFLIPTLTLALLFIAGKTLRNASSLRSGARESNPVPACERP